MTPKTPVASGHIMRNIILWKTYGSKHRFSTQSQMKMNYLGNQSLCEVDMLLSRLDLSLDKQDLPGTPRHGQSHTDWFII